MRSLDVYSEWAPYNTQLIKSMVVTFMMGASQKFKKKWAPPDQWHIFCQYFSCTGFSVADIVAPQCNPKEKKKKECGSSKLMKIPLLMNNPFNVILPNWCTTQADLPLQQLVGPAHLPPPIESTP